MEDIETIMEDIVVDTSGKWINETEEDFSIGDASNSISAGDNELKQKRQVLLWILLESVAVAVMLMLLPVVLLAQ
jgi:hypothetical protein